RAGAGAGPGRALPPPPPPAATTAPPPPPGPRLYRDWVLDAFNADMPYDRFLREQLAGDILARSEPAERYAPPLVATGFLALSRRYATAPYELWPLTLEDTIDTVGQAFLGLTLRCARCHDHKFDPVTAEDYYALYGIFASTQFPYAGSEEFQSMRFPRRHFAPLLAPGHAAPLLRAYEQRLRELQQRVERAPKEAPLALTARELDGHILALTEQLKELESYTVDPGVLRSALAQLTGIREAAARALQAKVNRLRAELLNLQRPGLPPDVPGAYAVSEGTPADAYIHRRGDPDA